VNVREKSLQSSGRCFSQNSDGFSTFSLQRGDLSTHITFEMPAVLRAVETVVKLFQKCTQLLANVFDFFCVHVDNPPNKVIQRSYRLSIFKFLSLYGAVVLRHPIDYTGDLLLTPRALKVALRRTWHAWSALHGEIDFDDLLISNVLRTGAPEAFLFINKNENLLKSISERADMQAGRERVTKSQTELNKLFEETTKDVKWDIVGARALIEFLFPGLNEQMWAKVIEAPQGINAHEPADCWSRLNKEDLEPGEIRDQDVLHAISEWKFSHSTNEGGNPNERITGTESELAKLICEKNRFAEKVEQFGCMIEGWDVRCLASEVFAKILREKKSASQGKDQEAFISLWRLSLDKNIRVDEHEEWVAKEIKKAFSVSLGFANDIYYYWRNQDREVVGHGSPTLELRKKVIDLAKKIFHGNGDIFAKVLDVSYLYSIYNLVVLFGQRDYCGPGFENEDWSWIGPLLTEGCKKKPNGFIPSVTLLTGDGTSSFRGGTFEHHFELQPDRIKKIFGDETKSLMQLLTTKVDLTHLDPQTKLTLEDARQKIANWASENQDV